MDKDQRDALFGKSTPFSEHKEGETIVFFEDSQVKTGTIIHVRAPGQAIIGGKEHGMLYMVDTGEGIPSAIIPSQVLEGTKPLRYFYVLLATYGYPDSACKNREEAENLAENVKGQVITGEVIGKTKRLRVLQARVEGNGSQGCVVGECEVVEKGEGEP